MIYYDICPETGDWIECEAAVLPSGKFRLKNDMWFRIGDARAPADEPWCNKNLDWNNGIKNPSNGQTYKNKQDYLDSVKRVGGRIVGEDVTVSAKKAEVKGDFNIRQELTKATRQVLAKRS